LTLIGNSNVQMALATPLAGARWYAAYTAPCREKRVAEHLAMRQIESFLPLYRLPRNWKMGATWNCTDRCFPAYVFVHVADTERVRVLEVPSVHWIVGRGRKPEPLDDDTIETLRANLHLRKVEPHPYSGGRRARLHLRGPIRRLSGHCPA